MVARSADRRAHRHVEPAGASSRTPTTSPARSGCSARSGIESELQERLALFEEEGKLLEAQRLRMRTEYDLEMMQEVGYCNGIENYSMHIDGRSYGEAPFTLLDYFPAGTSCHRHRRVARRRPPAPRAVRGRPEPQGGADRARLPAAVGGRQPPAPLRGGHGAPQPGRVPVGHAGAVRAATCLDRVVEQIVRPTGLVDPEVDRQADQGSDRRPPGADPAAHRASTSASSSRRSPRRWPRT